jgi:dimethylamine monooxygenase subunit A
MTTAVPYLPFADGKPFALRMGLQPLAAEQWIEIDDAYAAQLAAKRDLLATRHGDVFQALPEARPAAEEALKLLLDHLRRYHADRFAFDGGKLRNVATGEVWDIAHSPLHPLEQAGRLVQEDFCVVQSGDKTWDDKTWRDKTSTDQTWDDTYRLTAGAVCFPSNWLLSDKIGRALADVHGPVPGYAEKLASPVDRFFKNLAADTIMARANWHIHATPDLFQAGHRLDAATAAAITPANAGEKLWLRVERQALRRLPQSGAVLFTIRTYVTQLSEAVCDGKSAQNLEVAVRTMPDDVAHYRSMDAFRQALLEWLEGRAHN